MGKITTAKAVEKAMALATRELAGKIDGRHTPYNCGDNNDFVYTDEESALKSAWEKKSFTHAGVSYKGKMIFSSGETKFDLRLVHGTDKAVFNYHVPFKKNDAAEKAAAKQSASDKKVAASIKADQAAKDAAKKEKEAAEKAAAKSDEERKKKILQAMATAWNALKKQPADKAAWQKAWLESNKNRKF